MKNTIRIERTIKEFTQDELAKMVLISRQTINSIELNKITPSIIIAMKIAKALQKKVEDLFILEEYD